MDVQYSKTQNEKAKERNTVRTAATTTTLRTTTTIELDTLIDAKCVPFLSFVYLFLLSQKMQHSTYAHIYVLIFTSFICFPSAQGTLYVRPVTTERTFSDPNTLQQYKELFQRFGDVKKVNTNRKREA